MQNWWYLSNMPHGNVRISLGIDATYMSLISKDGQLKWLSFEMWLRSVPFIIREIFTFSWGMSARDGNFLHKTQANTKHNIYIFVLDQLWIHNNSTKVLDGIGCDRVIVTTFRSESDSYSEFRFSQYVIEGVKNQQYLEFCNIWLPKITVTYKKLKQHVV